MGLGIPAALSLSGFLGYAILSHAGDDEKESRLTAVEQVAVKLGKIHEAEDAAEARTVELCNADQVSDCRTCKDVGVFDSVACER